MGQKSPKRLGIARSVLIGIIIVIIIIAVVAIYFLLPRQGGITQVQAISAAPTSFLVIQGTPITFSIYNVQSGATLKIYFGDGNVT
ncbi:MAG: hypothetical protein QW250_06655, partial [Sulfolobaceae archaeon]